MRLAQAKWSHHTPLHNLFYPELHFSYVFACDQKECTVWRRVTLAAFHFSTSRLAVATRPWKQTSSWKKLYICLTTEYPSNVYGEVHCGSTAPECDMKHARGAGQTEGQCNHGVEWKRASLSNEFVLLSSLPHLILLVLTAIWGTQLIRGHSQQDQCHYTRPKPHTACSPTQG